MSGDISGEEVACKVYEEGRKEGRKEETLFKCLVVLALEHYYWGHYKFKLTNQENRSTRRKTSQCRVENQTQPTHDAEFGNRTRAILVGGGCSHHCAIPAPEGCQ